MIEGEWQVVRKTAMMERIRQVEQALGSTPRPLSSAGSNESLRASSGPGLAMLPFLTINDIIALRTAGFRGLQDVEQRILEVPDPAWPHVLDLVRAGIARIGPQALVPPPPPPEPKIEPKARPHPKPRRGHAPAGDERAHRRHPASEGKRAAPRSKPRAAAGKKPSKVAAKRSVKPSKKPKGAGAKKKGKTRKR